MLHLEKGGSQSSAAVRILKYFKIQNVQYEPLSSRVTSTSFHYLSINIGLNDDIKTSCIYSQFYDANQSLD